MTTCYNFLYQVVRGSAAIKVCHLRALYPQKSMCARLYSSTSPNVNNAAHASVASLPTGLWQNSLGCPSRPQILQAANLSWSICRTYAKRGKDKGGKAHKKMTLTSDQLEGLVDMDRIRQEFDHVLADLKEKFIHQLTVRTSPGVFDQLMVKTPSGNFPLIQLGQVVQKSPQLLTINMASSPQYIPQVKQALSDSGMNINPQQDGTSLFIPLPKVTREHRENLAKNAKMLSEQSKKSMREIYSKFARKIKASKQGHSSDDLIAADDMVKDLMHTLIHQVEEMTALKQKELLGGK